MQIRLIASPKFSSDVSSSAKNISCACVCVLVMSSMEKLFHPTLFGFQLKIKTPKTF